MIKAESRSNLFFPPLGAATANDNAIKLTHIWINRRSEQMCIDWHLCYWCNETQARSSRSISRGPNCEKEQRLHIHSALSISKVCATVVSYYKAIVSVKYRHTVQIKFFKCYTYWPKWRLRTNGSCDMYTDWIQTEFHSQHWDEEIRRTQNNILRTQCFILFFILIHSVVLYYSSKWPLSSNYDLWTLV